MKLHLGMMAAAVAVTAAASAHAQFSNNMIKLGILDDFSGQYCTGNCQGPIIATQIAVDQFHGKIDGVPIVVVHGDHQDKPDIGVAIAERWYDRENVDVILDVVNSAVALGVQNVAKQRHKAVLYSEAGSADLTGKECAPYSAQWTYDTYEMGKAIGEAVPYLGKKWFILGADYNYGHLLANSTAAAVKRAGGQVLGIVFHPFGASDMSSFILQAQSSGATVLALADAGGDTTNAIKAAKDFGLIASGVKIVPLSLDVPFIESSGGLATLQGAMMTLPWYPGANPPQSQWFSTEFQKRQHMLAPYLMVGLYSAVHTYLLAAHATKSDDPSKIFPWMRAHKIDDAFTKDGVLRPDGRMVHSVFLVQVKTPKESNGPDDLVKLVATIPGDKAFRPMDEGGCPYIKSASK
jgi:branched-chain amino acid transport system substrate-binding protein